MRHPAMRPLTARTAVARAAAWGEVRRRLGAHAAIEAGLRLTTLEGDDGRTIAEPRLAVRGDGRASPLGAYAWRVAAGGYRQFVPEFDVAAFGPSALVPSVRFWLPASPRTGVPRATHLAAELAAEPVAGWAVHAEGYARRHPTLLAFDYGVLVAGAGDTAAGDPSAFVGGARGYAYGGGARVTRASGRRRAELGYDYGQARRTFPSRFDGALQPVPWNTPHRARLAIDVLPADVGRATGAPIAAALGAMLRVRGTWGRTWALRQVYYDLLSLHGSGVGLPIGRPGDAPRPALYEVDAGVTWARRVAGARVEVGASVLDLLGQRNVLDYALAPAPDGGFARVRRPVLGAQPVITARVGW
jgi:hypothetical protein